MSFLNKLFNSQKVECPRCLGKGHVNFDDIRRLQKELKWHPGECAYCDATGRISSKMLSKIPVDTTYLTTDIAPEEKELLFAQDINALERAENHDKSVNGFIKQVEYLYFTANLPIEKIFAFYLISEEIYEISQAEKNDLIDYIERIVAKNKSGY